MHCKPSDYIICTFTSAFDDKMESTLKSQSGAQSMKYSRIVTSRFGGPENLILVEDELPEPRANEVRVT